MHCRVVKLTKAGLTLDFKVKCTVLVFFMEFVCLSHDYFTIEDSNIRLKHYHCQVKVCHIPH